MLQADICMIFDSKNNQMYQLSKSQTPADPCRTHKNFLKTVCNLKVNLNTFRAIVDEYMSVWQRDSNEDWFWSINFHAVVACWMKSTTVKNVLHINCYWVYSCFYVSYGWYLQIGDLLCSMLSGAVKRWLLGFGLLCYILLEARAKNPGGGAVSG